MKKLKRILTKAIIICCLACLSGLTVFAGTFDDASTFYNTYGSGNVISQDSEFYWATRSGTAVSTWNWTSQGFWISLTSSNTGQTLRFYVDKDDCLIHDETSGSYTYCLFCVTTDKLYNAVIDKGYNVINFFSGSVAVVMDAEISIDYGSTIKYGPYDLGSSSEYSSLKTQMTNLSFGADSFTAIEAYKDIKFTLTPTEGDIIIDDNSSYIWYNPNGGTLSSTTYDLYYGTIRRLSDKTRYFDPINYNTMSDPYNATTFGLTKEGYTFVGWNTKADGSGTFFNQNTDYYATDYMPSIKTAEPGGYVTLYAQWEVNTTSIWYNPNGGTLTSTTYDLYSGTIRKISTLTRYFHTITYGTSDDPYNATTFGLTKTGYTFVGWNTSADGTGTFFDQNTDYSATAYKSTLSTTNGGYVILYAQWEINKCTITLNANGGTLGTTTSYTIDYGGTVSLWSASWATRTGYTFLGYSTDPNATTAEFLPRYTTNSNIYTIMESDIWYAVWEKIECTITLNANGGTLGTTTSYTVDYGGTVSLWSASWATRTGYTFLGYSTSPNATTAEFLPRYTTNSNIYTITESDIWYAVWEINKCTITLNANGGMLGSITSYTVDYGGTVSLWSASWATREGYTFLGYSTNPNATTAEFLPRYTTNSNIYTITQSDTWYAVWKVNTDIYPEFIVPNATYYSGIDIIASFNIVNDGALDFTQSSGIDVNLEVYSVSHTGSSSLILNNTKSIVIPKYEENLVYWKVSIPTNAKQLKYVVTVSSNADETDFNNNSKTYEVNVATLVNSQTEDTIFENTPTGFTLPSVNTNISGLIAI